ncbi:hypothetical protein KUTeg_006728 [Tegillarca granosa]|uniref:Photolyase/cryptochrome alpha/beta domain-containing protein n=1 Tax=Tegillarca granosa TaxID=220873 RepID=A0ABQ9FFX7_TEGGR|nr:hypothetical protein KUTeg_006728 [Tegillarca granosa]
MLSLINSRHLKSVKTVSNTEIMPKHHSRRKNILHWFRKGLRLHDNPALKEALEGANTYRCVYILDPWFAGSSQVGINKWRFLLECLEDLDAALRKLNSRLFVIRGQPTDVFPRIFREWKISTLTFEEDPEPFGKERDSAIRALAKEAGVDVVVRTSHTLYELQKVITLNNGMPPLTYKRFQSILSKMDPPKQPIENITAQTIGKCKTPLSEDHDEKYGVPTLEELGCKIWLRINIIWHLKFLCVGKTGFPWIDAIMTQLRQTGWIHHLARHAVACFLTRGDLWISWEEGMKVFEELLLDADWSVNAGMWMWLSCSSFFQQFFHCYCPVGFGKRADPTGDFIRHYLPVLKGFPPKYIYEPWNAPESVQKAAKCIIGKDYPLPMVSHAEVSRINTERMKHVYQKLALRASAASIPKSIPHDALMYAKHKVIQSGNCISKSAIVLSGENALRTHHNQTSDDDSDTQSYRGGGYMVS